MFMATEDKKIPLLDVQLVVQIEKRNERTEQMHGPQDSRHTEPTGTHTHLRRYIAQILSLTTTKNQFFSRD